MKPAYVQKLPKCHVLKLFGESGIKYMKQRLHIRLSAQTV